MRRLSTTEWPPDIECEVCDELVDDGGFQVRYESLLMPSSVYEPDFYGWCEEHRPETAEAEQEVLEGIKYEPREDWLDRIRERVCLCPGMHLDNDNQLINIPDGLTAEEQMELRNLAIDSAPGRSHKE